MAMDASGLKAKLKERIYNGLKAEFGSSASSASSYSPIADEHWMKIATAISGIAADIVLEITQNGEVLAGIPTVGGPSSQVTVAPGKIL